MSDNPENTKVARGEGGKWLPGVSPNPGGRKGMPAELREAFRSATSDALKVLKEVMLNKESKDADRIKASDIILTRAWGRPEQSVIVEGTMASAKVDISQLDENQQDVLLSAVTASLFTSE